jgi:hypothetical protein
MIASCGVLPPSVLTDLVCTLQVFQLTSCKRDPIRIIAGTDREEAATAGDLLAEPVVLGDGCFP